MAETIARTAELAQLLQPTGAGRPRRVTGNCRRLFRMQLQVSAGQRSAARIDDDTPGIRNGDVEGVVPDSRLAVIARRIHREAVPVDVVHACAAGEGHAGGPADQPERVDRQAVYVQARGVVAVLQLAVEPAAPPRARIESEGGDIAA